MLYKLLLIVCARLIFMLLCLPSVLHIKFLKNSSLLSTLIFSLLSLDLTVSIVVLFLFCIFQQLWSVKFTGVKSQKY